MDKRISFLITHYNRPEDLFACIQAINKIKSDEDEIVVTDDSSEETFFNKINRLDIDVLVTSNKNTGLASNINRGLKKCSGRYILYCQEDFLLSGKLKNVLPSLLSILDKKEIDLIRLKSYLTFKKLITLNTYIDIIPLFSIKNFEKNCLRYSDHPFIVSNRFFIKYGYYLENTSGGYGETEFSIRLNSKKAKIGITKKIFSSVKANSFSVMDLEGSQPRIKRKGNKKVIRFLRSFRLHVEWFLYRFHKRGLITYKNIRENSL